MSGLVLARFLNQKIRIGDDIVITVIEHSDYRVRLHFDAPPHVQIWRQEIYDAKQRTKDEGEEK